MSGEWPPRCCQPARWRHCNRTLRAGVLARCRPPRGRSLVVSEPWPGVSCTAPTIPGLALLSLRLTSDSQLLEQSLLPSPS